MRVVKTRKPPSGPTSSRFLEKRVRPMTAPVSRSRAAGTSGSRPFCSAVRVRTLAAPGWPSPFVMCCSRASLDATTGQRLTNTTRTASHLASPPILLSSRMSKSRRSATLTRQSRSRASVTANLPGKSRSPPDPSRLTLTLSSPSRCQSRCHLS